MALSLGAPPGASSKGREIESLGRLGPVPQRVVDVGEHGEGIALAYEALHLAHVLGHELHARSPGEQSGRLPKRIAVGLAVQGARDPIETASLQYAHGGLGVPVRLAQHEAGQIRCPARMVHAR
jgi:hypothetical protein